MSKPIPLQILEWNRERNQLEYNLNLEVQMLTEEANEFFFAKTLVDRIDAYCDFKYVVTGTQIKFYAQKRFTTIELENAEVQFKKIKAWAEDTLDQMFSLLTEELELLESNDSRSWSLLRQAYEAVVQANNQKGKKLNANGKVMKGESYTPPEDIIRTILKANGINIEEEN